MFSAIFSYLCKLGFQYLLKVPEERVRKFLAGRKQKAAFRRAVLQAGTELRRTHPEIATDFLEAGFVDRVLSPLAEQLENPAKAPDVQSLQQKFSERFVERFRRHKDDHPTLRIYLRPENDIRIAADVFLRALLKECAASPVLRSVWANQTLARMSETVADVHVAMKDVQERIGNIAAPIGAPTELVDKVLESAFTRVQRRRVFLGVDPVSDAMTLVHEVRVGQYGSASKSLIGEVLAFASRTLSGHGDANGAAELLKDAQRMAPSARYPSADAWLFHAKGDNQAALRAVRDDRTPAGRAATLALLRKTGGAAQAIQWMEQERVSTVDLTGIGLLVAANCYIEVGRWDAALGWLERSSEQQQWECPAIVALLTVTYAALVVHPEFREMIRGMGLTMDPRLMVSHERENWRDMLERARACAGRVAAYAAELDALEARYLAEEFGLWLGLEHPVLRDAARCELIQALTSHPQRLRFVPLALSYGVPVAIDDVKEQLKQRSAVGGLSHWEARTQFVLATDPRERLELIRNQKSYIREYISPRGLLAFEVEALVETDQLESASDLLRRTPAETLPEEERQRLWVLIDQARGIDFGHSLADLANRTGSIADLRALCSYLLKQEKWEELEQRARHLLQAHAFPADAEMLCIALRNLDRDREIPEVLDAVWEKLEPTPTLQAHLAAGQFACGRMNEAKALIEGVRTVRVVHGDDVLAASIAVETGEWESLGQIAERSWNERNSRSAEQLIWAARLALEVGNTERTMQLVELAVQKAPDDPQVLIAAYSTTFDLGLEEKREDIHGWFERAIALSGDDGPIQKKSLQDLMDMQPQWAEQTRQTTTEVLAGNLPLVVAARSLRTTLSDLILGTSVQNSVEADPRKRHIIPLFHGSRTISGASSWNSVVLDVTTMMALEVSGCLTAALHSFGAVIIPAGSMGALFSDRQRIRFHQPSRIAAAERIVKLVAQGTLQVFETGEGASDRGAIDRDLQAMLDHAKRTGGVVATPAPLRKVGSLVDEIADSAPYASELVDLMTLVAVLKDRGEIDGKKAEAATNFLKRHDAGWAEGRAPVSDQPLYLDQLAVSFLNTVGLLDKVAEISGGTWVSRSTRDEALALIEYQTNVAAKLDLLESVRKKVRDALRSGHASVSPHERASGEDEWTAPTLQILSGLATADVVAIDDRAINKNAVVKDKFGKTTPIVTSLDIIEELARKAVISGDERNIARHKLRSSHAICMPLDEAELWHWVSAAAVSSTAIVETRELRSIRENLGRLSILDCVRFPSEFLNLGEVSLAFMRCLRRAWREAPTTDAARKQSDWIYDVLPDPVAWGHAWPADQMVASCTQRLVAQLVLLAVPDPTLPLDRRRAFAEWCEHAIFNRIKSSRPDLYDEVLSALKKYVKDLLNDA